MTLGLEIFALASAVSGHAGQRQGLIAQNVANADTPGYRAKDIPGFLEVYGEATAQDTPMRQTRAGHIESLPSVASYRVIEDAAFGAEQPNGNTVSLEDQMLRSVEARQMHDLAMGVYSKTLDIMRLGLQRR